VFVMSDEFILTYLCSALGSGIGIVLSIITYSRAHKLLTKKSLIKSQRLIEGTQDV
jgi:hypothetical protein